MLPAFAFLAMVTASGLFARPGLFLGGVLHRFLDLLEGADLDLPDTLAADVVFLRQLLERGRIVAQAPRLEDRLLAFIELAHGAAQQPHALVVFLGVAEGRFLVRRGGDEPVLPFRRA